MTEIMELGVGLEERSGEVEKEELEKQPLLMLAGGYGQRPALFKSRNPGTQVKLKIPVIVVSTEGEEFEGNKARNKLLRYEFKKDEQEYLGEVADNKAHGHGVFLFRGCKFGGLWENGFECIGCYIWPNEVRYAGTWSNGKRNGEGVELHKNYVYKGEWVEDLKEGYGVLSSNNSECKYEGLWNKGLQEGYGIEAYKDGSFYAGQFEEGMRNGYGVRVERPSDKLKQVFTHDDRERPSSREKHLLSDNSKVLSDNDLDNNEHRNAVFLPCVDYEGDPSKKMVIYEGHWKADSRHGPGIEKTSRGEIFEGTFKDNKKHGYGLFRDEHGHVIYGKWEKGVFKVNKRILNSAANKAAVAAREAAVIAQRKTWLSKSRADGARKCATESAEKCEQKAIEHYNLAVERKIETERQLELGNTSINMVAPDQSKPQSPSSGVTGIANLAKDLGKDFKSRISDKMYSALSPKLGRKTTPNNNSASPESCPKTPNSTHSTPMARLRNDKNNQPRPRSLMVQASPTPPSARHSAPNGVQRSSTP